MSGIVYPSGPQLLRIPTTILLPSTATPFNPNAVNPSVEQCWDSIKATEFYGFYKTTFDAAQPPYPAGGSFQNSGTYKIAGQIQFNTSGTPVAHAAVRTYTRVAHLNAYAKTDGVGNYWELGITFAPPKGYYVQRGPNGGPSSDSGLVFDVDLPSGCTVTEAAVRFKPATGHAALPSVQPFLYVYIVDSVNGTTTLVDSVQSAETLPGTYEGSVRTISCSFSQAFDAGRYRIFLVVFGEHGTDTVAGLQMYLPTIKFQRAQIGEELGELVP